MTNFERLKNLNEEDFADYIYSIFLAGKLCQRYTPETEDYKDWLSKEYTKPTHKKGGK